MAIPKGQFRREGGKRAELGKRWGKDLERGPQTSSPEPRGRSGLRCLRGVGASVRRLTGAALSRHARLPRKSSLATGDRPIESEGGVMRCSRSLTSAASALAVRRLGTRGSELEGVRACLKPMAKTAAIPVRKMGCVFFDVRVGKGNEVNLAALPFWAMVAFRMLSRIARVPRKPITVPKPHAMLAGSVPRSLVIAR